MECKIEEQVPSLKAGVWVGWAKSGMGLGVEVLRKVHCKAVQDAVPTHDAMIVSSGTGTAGPMMGTMHSP